MSRKFDLELMGIKIKPCDCYDKIEERCNGTCERDFCSCGGDESKCNFYPKKINMNLEKVLSKVEKVDDFLELILHGTDLQYATKRSGISNMSTCEFLDILSRLWKNYEYEEDLGEALAGKKNG